MSRFAPAPVAMVMILSGCALVLPEESRYLRNAQGKDSQEAVARHLGKPLFTTVNPRGETVWIYQLREQEPGNRWTSTGLWCDEYVLTFDDRAILRSWTHKSQFHGGELMPTYCVPGGVASPIAAGPKREIR